MWDKCGMSRNEKGLKEAIKEINELREDFYKNVNVPGKSNEFNEQLAKAGRVADFLELGESFLPKMPLKEQNLVEDTLEKNRKHLRVKH